MSSSPDIIGMVTPAHGPRYCAVMFIFVDGGLTQCTPTVTAALVLLTMVVTRAGGKGRKGRSYKIEVMRVN